MTTVTTTGKLADELETFLKGFRDRSGADKYRSRLSQAILLGGKSLVADFDDLLSYDVEVANRLLLEPDEVLESFDRAAYETLRVENAQYAEKLLKTGFKVRIRNLPDKLSLRGVTTVHLDRLVAVSGMAVRTSELKPLATRAAFKCRNGHITYEEQRQSRLLLSQPAKCDECDETRNFELDERQTEFVDYQVIRLQELPEELPPGQLPQYFDVNLIGDIVNTARPGDRVVLTGVVRVEPEFTQSAIKLRTFRSRIDGNYVEVLGKEQDPTQITTAEEDEIKTLAAQPNIYEKLIASIAPSILGYETQKEAILLLMVGAPQRILPDGTTLRGDVNCLLVGDPGTAKSELLKYSARIAPRGLYTSGRGSTAAGLTAAVVREKTGMMMLEAGAVVLADQGVACIDEFDKMRPEDRNALHETMEQQTVSVAKGGIVATLNARTSILAAANPVFGKYDPYRNIVDNLNLPIPLMTRFDLIFVIRDIPDRTKDENLARHVLDIHKKGTFSVENIVGFEFLKKYLMYARKTEPVLTKEAEDKITEYYLQMRNVPTENMITVTPRQLEGLVRLATARARVMLHEKVTEEDALRAIGLVRKMLETAGVDVKTKQVDVGVFYGRPMSERTLLETAIDVFKQLEGPTKKSVDGKAFVDALFKTGKFKQEDAQRMFQNLHKSGQIYEVEPGKYRKL